MCRLVEKQLYSVSAPFVPAALRDCNVGSTKELLHFALVGQQKFFHFISTIGVIRHLPGCTQDLDEHVDISTLR